MKYITIIITAIMALTTHAQEYNSLTKEETHVIENKGTERAFVGEYTKNVEEGTYICKKCNAPLYNSTDKFESSCGWPSFDDEIEGAVIRIPDADGRRTEIICANCNGHLGHVFLNEGFTNKNIRHCVNSISMNFIAAGENIPNKITKNMNKETAYLASGCFWGTEYHLQKIDGVISTTVGYIGGTKENPTYKEVCSGNTGHAETAEVVFDPTVVSYEEVVKVYFETHDPTQVNRQGPDIGTQYRSEIFYTNEKQKEVAQKLIKILEEKGYNVATEVTPAPKFYPAEDYHQDYYDIKGSTPYCHIYKKLF